MYNYYTILIERVGILMKRNRNLRFLTGFIVCALLLASAFSIFTPVAESSPAAPVIRASEQSDVVEVYKPESGAESLNHAQGLMSGSVGATLSEYVEGEAIVVIEAPSPSAYSVMGAFSENNYSQALVSQAEAFADKFDLEVLNTFSEIAVVTGKSIIHLRSDYKSADELIQELSAAPEVESASPNYITKLNNSPAYQISTMYEASNNDLIPNDPGYSNLWGMENIGMPEVWDHFTGNNTVVVAVIDSGIDYNHPDINANMARDTNGYYGRHYYNNGSVNTDPINIDDHGTHVAGTIGAAGNNGIGVVGVNWQVKMLAVNTFSETPSGIASYSTDLFAGMNYVLSEKSRGLNIRAANMSFGGWLVPQADDSAYGYAVRALSDAGIICVIAVGNEAQNINNPSGSYTGQRPYPACFRFANTIAVGAINFGDVKRSASNYGNEWVDIAAPGGDIYSTIPNSGYDYNSGTSMAAPHVTGAAALLSAAFPSETAAQIKARILSMARNSGVSEGYWANGVLDAAGAYKYTKVITTAAELDAVRDSPNAYYTLGNDIDLTEYLAPGGAGFSKWGNEGWAPIGTDTSRFSGRLDGNGYKITGLWIDRSNTNRVGLFGYCYNAEISNVGVEIGAAGLKGNNYVGGLAGHKSAGSVTNCYVTGYVTGSGNNAGGLVGRQDSGSITKCYATGYVSGYASVGGLVGYSDSDSSITNCYATGYVTSPGYLANSGQVGGLVGCNRGGVANCYAAGDVSSAFYVGGLVGRAELNSNITNCYATGNVSGSYSFGGLVGSRSTSSIANSYRFEFAAVNGSVIPADDPESLPNGRHGGVKTAAELMTKTTYTGNSWLFNDSAPTSGPWYWDSGNFPKLNMGTENFPFDFAPVITIISQPAPNTTVTQGSISDSLSVSASVTQGATLTYQWYRNTTDSNTGGAIESGATNSSFAIPTNLLNAGSPYYFYCVVSTPGAASVSSNVATVTVNELFVPVTGVTVSPKMVIIAQATTYTLQYEVFPANATIKNIMWESSNEDVAFVSISSGQVTGLAEGKATISATTVYGGFTDSCEVTVVNSASYNPPGITGPSYMELNSGYAATVSKAFSITGTEPVTVTANTSGNESITWDATNKRFNIAAGLRPEIYPVFLTASNGITPDAAFRFDLSVINVPPGSARLYFAPENIIAGKDKTFTVTFKVNSEPFNYVECFLAYDPQILELEAATQIPPPSDWTLTDYSEWAAEFVLSSKLGSNAILSGDTSVATLRFKALKETTGTDISIFQIQGNDGTGSSILQYQALGSQTLFIPFTTQGCTVTVVEEEATLKASFQGRSMLGASNIENLVVKWISGDAVIAEETVTSDQNGEAEIAIPQQKSGLSIWVKGERTLAVSQNIGTLENGSVISVGTLYGGDSNGDNMVDLNDFNVFTNNYGRNTNSPGLNRFTDFNNDGLIDLNDFNIFLNSYGKTGAPLPGGYSPSAMSMISQNEESEESSVNKADSDSGCNVGMTGFTLLMLLALPLFMKSNQKERRGLKRIFCIFLVISAISVMPSAGSAAVHTMMVSTDKDTYMVGEKFNVSVVTTLANDESVLSISSVISFDNTALSVDNSSAATALLLQRTEIEGLTARMPLIDPPAYIIGGTVSSMEGNEPVPAGTYVMLRNAVFEAVTPGTYELVLPENNSYPYATTSFLVKRDAAGELLLVIPSTKIYKTITIIPSEEQVAPTITSANNTTVASGAGGTFQVTANGTAPITFSLSGAGLPNGVSINSITGLITVDASVTTGLYLFAITATNGINPDAIQLFMLTVDRAPVAPTITSANNTTVTSGAGGTFQVTATGTSPITFSLDGSPTGVSINRASGVITIAASAAAGTYTFTITASNGVNPDATQVFTLTVTNELTAVLVTSVTLNKSYASIHKGSDEQLTATVLPSAASDKRVTWSCDNPWVATVDANGLVSAIGAGSAIITVKTVDGGFEATCYVAVTTPATGVTISPPAVSLDVGEIYLLMVTVAPFNVSNSNVAWSSSNEAVATVTQGGLVRAVSGGTTTITATAADGSGVSDTCTVNVVALMTDVTMDMITTLSELPLGIPTDIGIVLSEPIIFIPVDSSDVSSQIDMLSAMMTNIKPEDLHVDEHGVITIQDWIAKGIAEKLPGADHAEVITLPVFEAVLNNAGETAAVSFKVKGSSLMFDGLISRPEDVKLLMILSPDSGDWFTYTGSISGLNDKTFTILDMSNNVFTGDLEPENDYNLLFLIKDGGSYDIDGQADGVVWGITALVGVLCEVTPEAFNHNHR